MTKEERRELMQLYADIRVCDARDGMDAMGYHFYGSIDQNIRPLFRTRAYGIAKTVRYLPFRGGMKYENPRHYRDEYTPNYYAEIYQNHWRPDLQDGDFVVIDQSQMCVGIMGSENTFACKNLGMRGLITNGGIRDTDEIILQKIPVWSASIAQTMVQARIVFDAKDIPVAIGGVLIRPGDMIVGDGDGVIAIPLEIARDVAMYAHEEHKMDKKNRKEHYINAGKELDNTIS